MEISFLRRSVSQLTTDEVNLLIKITNHNFSTKIQVFHTQTVHEGNTPELLSWDQYPLWENGRPDSFPYAVSSDLRQWIRKKIGSDLREYCVQPICIGGFIPFFWINNYGQIAGQEIENSLLLTFHQFLRTEFSLEKLKKIPSEPHLQHQVLTVICQFLAPIAYRRHQQTLWVPFCRTVYSDVPGIVYDLTFGSLKAGPCLPESFDWFKDQLTKSYQEIQEKWELCHQQHVQIADRIQELTTTFERSQAELEQYLQRHTLFLKEITSLKLLAENLTRPGTSNPFEFFRGTDAWVIRFDNKPVKMKNKYTLGLIYIHQLLLNPDKPIYCHQLYLRSNNDLEQASPVWKEIHQRFGYHNIADSEQEWKDAIDRIEKSIENASVELKADLREYIVFLAEQRYRNHISKANFQQLLYYQNKLKNAKLEIPIPRRDEVHFQRQITLRGVLFKNAENPKDRNRKIYQNVTKAIKRTINAMDDQAIIRHFDQCLKIGNPCCYQPESAKIEAPNWKLWIE